MRGLAAASILVMHVWMYTGANDAGVPAPLDAVLGELRVGLIFFFVVSAFLLVRPWARGRPPALGRYALHRAARILPAYWVALLGAYALLTGTGHGREAAASELWAHLLLVQNQVASTAGALNPPAWSLGVEVAFYALLPAAAWVALRRGGLLMVAGVFVAAGLGWSLAAELADWPATVTTSLPTYLPVFGCGVAACALAKGRAVGAHARRALLVAGGLAVVANGVWHAGGTGLAGHVVRDLPAAAGFACVAVALTAGRDGLLDRAPLRALGKVSYGVYLWHMPVLYALQVHALLPDAPAAAMAAVAGPTLVLATLSWLAVERPALALADRAAPRRAPERLATAPASA